MLLRPKKIILDEAPVLNTKSLPKVIDVKKTLHNDLISGILDKSIGYIENGHARHFYSFGNFNMMRLIFHLLKQTGPAHIIMSSYSISPKTIEGIISRKEKGLIQSFRLIVDNRVRSISARPFDMIVRNFDYRCTSIHAKVACIYNENWKVTVVSSQNATDNPKIERGMILTDPEIFNFDFKTLCEIYDNGTT